MEAAQTSFENLLLMKTPATIMIIFQLGDAYVAIAVLKKTCSSGPRPTQLLFYSFSPQNQVSGFRVQGFGLGVSGRVKRICTSCRLHVCVAVLRGQWARGSLGDFGVGLNTLPVYIRV